MSKERISATVDQETVNAIEKLLKKSKYRNKSHIIESAIAKLLEEEHEPTTRR